MDIEKPRKPRAPRKSKASATGNVTDDMSTQTIETAEAPATMGAASAPEAAAAPNTAPATPAAAAPADATLHLSAGLEIKDVEGVHRQLTGMLDRGSHVTVDISHVAAMDTAGVQLLLAFQGEAARRGVSIEYSGRSNAFTHALTAVGLGDAVRHVASRD
jgi:anti-anti-sigma regulatory factor